MLAADCKRVLLHLEIEVSLGKPRHGDADTIGVFAGPLDVVGRITRRRAVTSGELIDERKEPVETDGRAIEGSKIECSHGISSFSERHAEGSPAGAETICCAAIGLAHPLHGG